jgi:hypothetical protein
MRSVLTRSVGRVTFGFLVIEVGNARENFRIFFVQSAKRLQDFWGAEEAHIQQGRAYIRRLRPDGAARPALTRWAAHAVGRRKQSRSGRIPK